MDINKVIHRVRAIREGGDVERCHTTPHHGSYNVAEHSWGVATLLGILHPTPSTPLILAALWHDVSERWTGDIPAPMKWLAGDAFKNELARVTINIEEHLHIDQIMALTTTDTKWLKACDMLEFLLWSIDQLALGNRYATEGRSNAEAWFINYKEEVPDIVLEFVSHYRWRRTSDRDGWKL